MAVSECEQDIVTGSDKSNAMKVGCTLMAKEYMYMYNVYIIMEFLAHVQLFNVHTNLALQLHVHVHVLCMYMYMYMDSVYM